MKNVVSGKVKRQYISTLTGIVLRRTQSFKRNLEICVAIRLARSLSSGRSSFDLTRNLVYVCVCAHVCLYVYMYVCMYVCVRACVTICTMDICTKDIESDHALNIRYIRVPRLQQTVGNILNDRCVSPSSARRSYFTVEKFCCGFWFDDTHVVNTSLQWLTTHSLLQYSSSHSLFATAGFGHP